MRDFVRLLASAAVSVVGVFGFVATGGYWIYQDLTGPGPLAEARAVVIPQRIGLSEIASLLTERGVIRHGWSFELGSIVSGRGAAMKAGEYEFPATASPLQAMDIIVSGKTVKHRLTIPEGLTSAEILALVRDAPELDGDPGPPPAEGVLLPETYLYEYGEFRQEVVERMERAMSRAIEKAWAERRSDLPLATPHDLLVLASLVEKEASREDEQARIAAVFVNRLRLGMPLQSDPTIIYALSDRGTKRLDRRLTHADLATLSPYNTYTAKGLPPGPIGNPGPLVLRAVARPAFTDDLYFVADGSGGHVFARTLAEHNRNVARYRHHTAASEPEDDIPARPPTPEEQPRALR